MSARPDRPRPAMNEAKRSAPIVTTIPTMSVDEKSRRNPERWIPCWRCKRTVEHRRNGQPNPHRPTLGSVDWCDAPELSAPAGSSTWPKEPAGRRNRPAPAEKPAKQERGVASRTIPSDIAAWVLHRDRHRCRRCGERDGLELHHVIEWSTCYEHDPDNIETLCGACHAEWTWSASVRDYETWKRIPPGRWLERLIALSMEDTPTGLAWLMKLGTMSALDLLDIVGRQRRLQLGVDTEGNVLPEEPAT